MQPRLSTTNAQLKIVDGMSVFHGMAMYGPYYKRGGVVLGSGPTALACSAGRWVLEFGLYGRQGPMTTAGPRSIPNIMKDGSTLMLVKRRGISPECIPKVNTALLPSSSRLSKLTPLCRMGMEILVLYRLLRRRGNRCDPPICAQCCHAWQRPE